MKHFLLCEAPICVNDPTEAWEKNVLWYPGEAICGKRPFGKIQKIQGRINRLFFKRKLKYPNTYYTGEMLERIRVVRPGIKGGNPDAKGYLR